MGRFTKGLSKDTAPADQPPGTFRFARNVIINKVDGAISNEGGNKIVTKIGRSLGSNQVADGYTVIGAIEITDDDASPITGSSSSENKGVQRTKISH